MKKLPFLLLAFALFSCSESVIEQVEPEQPEETEELGSQFVVTDVYGRKYPSLDPSVIYCGWGWGAKMCHFLYKYDGTIWADSDNYYSDFSDIAFLNFWDPYFISFFDIDSVTSYCKGWKLGETTHDGVTWDINIKKDEEDVLWFDYDYYGAGDDIEYTITYKYEVIEGLLHFSSTDGETFIFHPSEKTYSEDFLNTDEIIELEGCLFY